MSEEASGCDHFHTHTPPPRLPKQDKKKVLGVNRHLDLCLHEAPGGQYLLLLLLEGTFLWVSRRKPAIRMGACHCLEARRQYTMEEASTKDPRL